MFQNLWLVCSLFFAWNLSAPQAVAQSCPDYFRFVDFGILGENKELRRGGPVFRVVEEGVSLLGGAPVTCLSVPYVFTDGHSHAIPVVSDIGYAPDLVSPHLSELSVKTVQGQMRKQADLNARAHRTLIDDTTTRLIRGSSYLCAEHPAASEATVSCEILNPFNPAYPLVVYCDEQVCDMPVMAIDSRLQISARWRNLEETDNSSIGTSISESVARIHAFAADKLSR